MGIGPWTMAWAMEGDEAIDQQHDSKESSICFDRKKEGSVFRAAMHLHGVRCGKIRCDAS